jgi:hypothetical protein
MECKILSGMEKQAGKETKETRYAVEPRLFVQPNLDLALKSSIPAYFAVKKFIPRFLETSRIHAKK